MSKTALKKELSTLTRDQVVELVLSAYTSSKEVKRYFDFFLNPDIESLTERYKAALTKEIMRGKRYDSRARISRIRATIKDFDSFTPGAEQSLMLRLFAIEALVERERHSRYSPTLIKGTLKLLNDCIAYADSHLLFDTAKSEIDRILKSGLLQRGAFKNYLRENMELPGPRL